MGQDSCYGLQLPLKNEQSQALCWLSRSISNCVLPDPFNAGRALSHLEREGVGGSRRVYIYQLKNREGDPLKAMN